MHSNLVVCSLGAGAAVDCWIQNAEGFDVALAYYGEGECRWKDRAQYFLAKRDFKVPNFVALFEKYPVLLQYERLFFIDDDLILTAQDVRSVFERVKAGRWDICQPSLTPDSVVSWPHLVHKKGAGDERTDFVEIQCFCVSQKFLRKALPFFYMAKTGFGLDVAFSLLMKQGRFRSAILHSVQVHHPLRQHSQTVRALQPDFEAISKAIVQRIEFCFHEAGTLPLSNQTSHLFHALTWELVGLWKRVRAVGIVGRAMLRWLSRGNWPGRGR